MSEKDHYVLGVLRACEFLAVRYDEPTMAADILRSEIIEGGFCTLAKAKRICSAEGIQLKSVWKEKSALNAEKQLAESYYLPYPMDCFLHVRVCGTCGKSERAWASKDADNAWELHKCTLAKAKGVNHE